MPHWNRPFADMTGFGLRKVDKTECIGVWVENDVTQVTSHELLMAYAGIMYELNQGPESQPTPTRVEASGTQILEIGQGTYRLSMVSC
jgi:hypothetical protein